MSLKRDTVLTPLDRGRCDSSRIKFSGLMFIERETPSAVFHCNFISAVTIVHYTIEIQYFAIRLFADD